MKRLFIIIAVSFGLVMPAVVAAPSVMAIDIFNQCSNDATTSDCVDCHTDAQNTDVCKEAEGHASTYNPVIKLIKTIINVISVVVGVASVIIIIISGLRMILASGDPKGIEEARSGIINALVGVVIVIISQAIVVFILNRIK